MYYDMYAYAPMTSQFVLIYASILSIQLSTSAGLSELMCVPGG